MVTSSPVSGKQAIVSQKIATISKIKMKSKYFFCSIQSGNNKSDAGSQTLSTGDIVIMKVYFKEDQEKGPERVIVSSPKRSAQ